MTYDMNESNLLKTENFIAVCTLQLVKLNRTQILTTYSERTRSLP